MSGLKQYFTLASRFRRNDAPVPNLDRRGGIPPNRCTRLHCRCTDSGQHRAGEHGVPTWIAVAITLGVIGTALHRLRKERALLNGRATTIATVTHWERDPGSVGGHVYSVEYRFLGPDGKEYVGKATSQVELPSAGEMLPISYMYFDPTVNLPLATFWFFRFTYTGIAKWMN